jgi:ribosomal protein S21
MAIVRAQPGDTNDSIIKKFTRKVIADEILPELMKRKHHMSDSEKRQERIKNRGRIKRTR